MKKKNDRRITFFNASELLEELSENEMFQLKGGSSDIVPSEPAPEPEPEPDYDELDEVEVVGQIPSHEEEEEEEPGFDPEDGYDWDDADNDPTDDDGWNDETGYDGAEDQTPPPPPDPSGDPNDGPWQRDANGNLIMTPTGRTLSKYSIGENKFDFTEVKLKTPSGQEITAYQVTAAYDRDGNPIPMEERFKSNCTGLAVAGGDVWITDMNEDDGTNNLDQGKEFESLLASNTLFQQVSKEEADFVVASYRGEIQHSGEYDPETGTYTWKNSQSAVKTGTYEQFSLTYDDDLTVTYYKRNY